MKIVFDADGAFHMYADDDPNIPGLPDIPDVQPIGMVLYDADGNVIHEAWFHDD